MIRLIRASSRARFTGSHFDGPHRVARLVVHTNLRSAVDIVPQGGFREGAPAALLETLCQAWLDMSRGSGAEGVSVACVVRSHLAEEVASTGAIASTLFELHSLLGEGPALRAVADRGPVLVADLRTDSLGAEWVTFAREAQAAGAVSYFAFPLQIGVVLVGVLTVHGIRPMRLDEADMAALLRLTARASLLVLAHSNDQMTHDEDIVLLPPAKEMLVHQATGMVMVQRSGTMDQALTVLRAHAYGTGQSLLEVSRLVVQRKLRFGERGAPTNPTYLDGDGHPLGGNGDGR